DRGRERTVKIAGIEIEAAAELCRGALQVGLGLLLQTTVVLLFGLLAGSVLRRRGSEAQSLVYRVALVGVVANALLVLGTAGRVTPFWTVSLPAAKREISAAPILAATAPLAKIESEAPILAETPEIAVPDVAVAASASIATTSAPRIAA